MKLLDIIPSLTPNEIVWLCWQLTEIVACSHRNNYSQPIDIASIHISKNYVLEVFKDLDVAHAAPYTLDFDRCVFAPEVINALIELGLPLTQFHAEALEKKTECYLHTNAFRLGCIAFEICCGRPMFSLEEAVEYSTGSLSVTIQLPYTLQPHSGALSEMIRGLLTSQPDTRWTSVTALQHMVDTYNIAESIAAIKLMNETTPSVAVDSLLQILRRQAEAVQYDSHMCMPSLQELLLEKHKMIELLSSAGIYANQLLPYTRMIRAASLNIVPDVCIELFTTMIGATLADYNPSEYQLDDYFDALQQCRNLFSGDYTSNRLIPHLLSFTKSSRANVNIKALSTIDKLAASVANISETFSSIGVDTLSPNMMQLVSGVGAERNAALVALALEIFHTSVLIILRYYSSCNDTTVGDKLASEIRTLQEFLYKSVSTNLSYRHPSSTAACLNTLEQVVANLGEKYATMLIVNFILPVYGEQDEYLRRAAIRKFELIFEALPCKLQHKAQAALHFSLLEIDQILLTETLKVTYKLLQKGLYTPSILLQHSTTFEFLFFHPCLLVRKEVVNLFVIAMTKADDLVRTALRLHIIEKTESIPDDMFSCQSILASLKTPVREIAFNDRMHTLPCSLHYYWDNENRTLLYSVDPKYFPDNVTGKSEPDNADVYSRIDSYFTKLKKKISTLKPPADAEDPGAAEDFICGGFYLA